MISPGTNFGTGRDAVCFSTANDVRIWIKLDRKQVYGGGESAEQLAVGGEPGGGGHGGLSNRQGITTPMHVAEAQPVAPHQAES